MPTVKYTLENIEGGISPTLFGPQPKGTYNFALGIDPDLRANPLSAANPKTGGAITPSGFTKFSSTGLTGYPLWMLADPKDSLIYVYSSSGNFLSYTDALASETALSTPTSGAGNGMAYYNNYIYLATPTNISRYGPLDGTPSLTNTVWTGATFMNDANKVLTNSTYPTIKQAALPNHAMHVHTDGFLYICDVISTSYATTAVQGKGVLHRIVTKKVTAEGDTNNGSAYDVLELPFGYVPVAIQSYGTDLAILGIRQINDTLMTLSRGSAAVFLWDTFAAIPYKQIPIPDPLGSALFNNNGKLYVFSGNTANGVRVSVYDGGDSFRQVAFLEQGITPFQGAVDAWEDRLVFGGQVVYPTAAAVVFALGSKNQAVDKNALHCIARTSGGVSTPVVTCLKYIPFGVNSAQSSGNINPMPLIGWGDSTLKGIDTYSTAATVSSQFSWKVDIGRPFSLRSIRVPLAKVVASNTAVAPTFYVDNRTSSTVPSAINNTNFSGNTVIGYKRPELAIIGQENFELVFEWSNTDPISLMLPIEVELDVFDVIKTG